ncbi:uncharacterized protein DNG_10286 [Cephalotrichum gorgonifer]|uniref:Uncharacterized protein n=1 Tax=Cephalotrichum gorgonifer TaxID=2041049 RepID=A0AAE8T069_9PEZI|nr:uncharacterized protein DNG_10286 [Cephalotrichum gorgonifer]
MQYDYDSDETISDASSDDGPATPPPSPGNYDARGLAETDEVTEDARSSGEGIPGVISNRSESEREGNTEVHESPSTPSSIRQDLEETSSPIDAGEPDPKSHAEHGMEPLPVIEPHDTKDESLSPHRPNSSSSTTPVARVGYLARSMLFSSRLRLPSRGNPRRRRQALPRTIRSLQLVHTPTRIQTHRLAQRTKARESRWAGVFRATADEKMRAGYNPGDGHRVAAFAILGGHRTMDWVEDAQLRYWFARGAGWNRSRGVRMMMALMREAQDEVQAVEDAYLDDEAKRYADEMEMYGEVEDFEYHPEDDVDGRVEHASTGEGVESALEDAEEEGAGAAWEDIELIEFEDADIGVGEGVEMEDEDMIEVQRAR